MGNLATGAIGGVGAGLLGGSAAGGAIGGTLLGLPGAAVGGFGPGLIGGIFGGGGDDEMELLNPGQINLREENPELFAELQRQREQRSQFQEATRTFIRPELIGQRIQDAGTEAETRATNQLARQGLAGSSAGIGAAGAAGTAAREQARDIALSQQLRSLQAQATLDSGVRRTILDIQGQFERLQNTAAGLESDRLAAEASDRSALLGGIGTIGGAVAGGLVGGPAGAAGGSAVGGKLGSGLAANDSTSGLEFFGPREPGGGYYPPQEEPLRTTYLGPDVGGFDVPSFDERFSRFRRV